jgi:predicted HD superfamily hydrolase involved in NAD metabolism
VQARAADERPLDLSGVDFIKLCRAIRRRMPESRYRHSLGVARTAARLARRYGASPDAARVAGVIHDVARNWSPSELLRYASERGLPVSPLERATPVLLHARVAAHIAQREYQVAEPQVLSAIEHHTLPVPGMSALEKIVYMADALEPSRSFAGRDALLSAAARSLDDGYLACLKSGLGYLLMRNIALPRQAVQAYNELVPSVDDAS